MDANLIYEKTAAGEDAVRQRTRVVQRNTRMVLILVDGKSSVAELCEKTGNVQLVESALQDLERDGLIAPKLEQDSVWEQSKKLAEEIKAAAVNRLSKEEHQAVQKPEPVPDLISPPSSTPEPFSIAPLSVFPGQSSFSKAPFSTFGGPPSVMPAMQKEVPEEKRPASVGERLSGFFSRKGKADADDAIKPIRRGPSGPYVSLPLAISLGVAGVVALIALIFFFYPYDSHRPQIEAAMSRMLGQPINVGEVRATFLPRPSISLERVRGDEASGVQAAHIRLVPEIFSLLGSRPVFSLVEISNARLTEKSLTALPKQLTDAFSSNAPASIQAINFSQLEVAILGLPLADLQSEIRPDQSGKLGPTLFQTSDRSLKVILTPVAGGFLAEFDSYGWKPEAESRFRFDSLQGKALWDGHSLSLQSVDARIFDGAIQGSLLFSREGQLALAGEINVKHMNLLRLAGALGYGTQFEGELAGALKFSGGSSAWSSVLGASSGEGRFSLQRGVLGGFDMVEGVRRGKGTVRGGATRYEQLNGRLTVQPESIRFSDLSLTSGALHTGGYLDVARDGKLAGRVEVELRGSSSVVRMPLSASGTLKEPLLQGVR